MNRSKNINIHSNLQECIKNNSVTRIYLKNKNKTFYYDTKIIEYNYHQDIKDNINFIGPTINVNDNTSELNQMLHDSRETNNTCYVPTYDKYKASTDESERIVATQKCIMKRIYHQLGPLLYSCLSIINSEKEYHYNKSLQNNIGVIIDEKMLCSNIISHKLITELMNHHFEINKLLNVYVNCTIKKNYDDTIEKYSVTYPSVNKYNIHVYPEILINNLLRQNDTLLVDDSTRYIYDLYSQIKKSGNINIFINNEIYLDETHNRFIYDIQNLDLTSNFIEKLDSYCENQENYIIKRFPTIYSIFNKAVELSNNHGDGNNIKILINEGSSRDNDLYDIHSTVVGALFHSDRKSLKNIIIPHNYEKNIMIEKLSDIINKITTFLRSQILNVLPKRGVRLVDSIDWCFNSDEDPHFAFMEFVIFYYDAYYFIIDTLSTTNTDFSLERRYLKTNKSRANSIIFDMINSNINYYKAISQSGIPDFVPFPGGRIHPLQSLAPADELQDTIVDRTQARSRKISLYNEGGTYDEYKNKYLTLKKLINK